MAKNRSHSHLHRVHLLVRSFFSLVRPSRIEERSEKRIIILLHTERMSHLVRFKMYWGTHTRPFPTPLHCRTWWSNRNMCETRELRQTNRKGRRECNRAECVHFCVLLSFSVHHVKLNGVLEKWEVVFAHRERVKKGNVIIFHAKVVENIICFWK